MRLARGDQPFKGGVSLPRGEAILPKGQTFSHGATKNSQFCRQFAYQFMFTPFKIIILYFSVLWHCIDLTLGALVPSICPTKEYEEIL
jgi:hypothetical protein